MRVAIAVVAAVLLVASPSLVQAAEPANAIVRKKVTISGKNDEWTNIGLKVAKGDILLVRAEGEVVVGAWTGAVSANGSPGEGFGKLVMKVGADSGNIDLGKSAYFITEDHSGTVKLKVWDKKYEDNSGSLTVEIIKIPAALVPEAVEVAVED